MRREIAQCNDDLNNSIQILSYRARTTNDTEVSHIALDGILTIVGEPSSEEKIYATSLDADGCNSVVANAEDTITYRKNLFKKESRTESALATDFHRYARQASTFRTLKWLSLSAFGILITFAILRRVL